MTDEVKPSFGGAPPSMPSGMPEGPLYPLNPGAYDELHRKCRDIFPMCFEGAKAMLQKGLSNNFQVSARAGSRAHAPTHRQPL